MSESDLAVWAWRGPGVGNFGDELGPAILSRLGYKVRRVETLRHADLVSCGSVMEMACRMPHRRDLVVWGSGLLRGKKLDISTLDVRAVRGLLTASELDLGDIAIGDPGILVSRLWEQPMTRHRLGVMTHYVDRRSYPWADVVIGATEPVDEVIEKIGSCEALATSSLHGHVVADAFGIPVMRLHHRDVVGGDFKWADYLTARAKGRAEVESALLRALP